MVYQASSWSEIADRIWIGRYEFLDQTIGVIGGEAGLVVIDTLSSPRQADGLRAEVGRLGEVVGVINTHGHWDHCFGNQRFRPLPIWGHVRCARMIEANGEDQRREVLEHWMPGADAELAEVIPTAPDHLFEVAARLELGDRTIDLSYLGLGHTDNDIVATVPDADILFVGDLLENAPAPNFGDSYPLNWGDTAARILEAGVATIVPGHGDPLEAEFVAHQVGQLAELQRLCRAAVAGDISWAEVAARSPFPADATAVAVARGRSTAPAV